MKPLRARFQEARKRLGLPWEVLERDYLLSWVLAGITRVDSLRDTLVFKGGTALRKCYFGDYRFSEDLDCTAVGSVPTGAAMESAVQEACARAVKLLDPYIPVKIGCERHVERDAHPGGQEAFDIRARFPWHRRPQTNVMVEIAVDERLLKPSVRRSVLYSDFPTFLRAKCAIRDVTFLGPDSFFPEAMLAVVEKTWTQWLGPLVPKLPPYKTVIQELRPQVTALLASKG
ncbi:MAG: nucleotidyl transferase AbiEii/AbiGii toxin family protein [candidate division NC10 bacterium]|nr:nucleotidyl transferase AbiEii/AbiGii toxin family protein [candidate division NC10 bacterium]